VEFLRFLGKFVDFLVFWEKVSVFGHPVSTAKIRILEDFEDF
jgi:hypothetical protein